MLSVPPKRPDETVDQSASHPLLAVELISLYVVLDHKLDVLVLPGKTDDECRVCPAPDPAFESIGNEFVDQETKGRVWSGPMVSGSI